MHVQPADDDPIICEIRRFREEYAARFGYDLDLMNQDLRRTALDWPGGRVSYDQHHPKRNADLRPNEDAWTTVRNR